ILTSTVAAFSDKDHTDFSEILEYASAGYDAELNLLFLQTQFDCDGGDGGVGAVWVKLRSLIDKNPLCRLRATAWWIRSSSEGSDKWADCQWARFQDTVVRGGMPKHIKTQERLSEQVTVWECSAQASAPASASTSAAAWDGSRSQ